MDDFTITDDREQIDPDACEQMLRKSFWAKDRPREIIEQSIQNSLNFGLFHRDKQIGMARVVTDYCTFGWLCDVFIEEEYRGRGLGEWLSDVIVNHPDLCNLRYFLLATKDAHALYAKFGWTPLDRPEIWMHKIPLDVKRYLDPEP